MQEATLISKPEEDKIMKSKLNFYPLCNNFWWTTEEITLMLIKRLLFDSLSSSPETGTINISKQLSFSLSIIKKKFIAKIHLLMVWLNQVKKVISKRVASNQNCIDNSKNHRQVKDIKSKLPFTLTMIILSKKLHNNRISRKMLLQLFSRKSIKSLLTRFYRKCKWLNIKLRNPLILEILKMECNKEEITHENL